MEHGNRYAPLLLTPAGGNTFAGRLRPNVHDPKKCRKIAP